MVNSENGGASEATSRPNAATLAFSDEAITSRVCDIFARWLAEEYIPVLHEETRIKFSCFTTLSCLTRAFTRPAQAYLNSDLVFTNGSQVKQWLSALGDQPSRYRTHRVYLDDDLPFRFSDFDDAKWNLNDLRRLFASVRGTSVIFLHFACQPALPADLLGGKHLKGLKFLSLQSPLVATESIRFAFGLICLRIGDAYPLYDRDWSATFRALTASPTPRTLRQLCLDNLPQACTHMLALTPFGPAIQSLYLPSLRLSEKHMWRLWTFARLCERLHHLSIDTFEGDTIAVLQAFPTGPTFLHFNQLVATTGYEHPDVDVAVIPIPDSIQSLVSALYAKARDGPFRVEHVTCTSTRLLTQERRNSLMMVCFARAIYSIDLGLDDNRFTREEERALATYVHQSRDRPRYAWANCRTRIEEIE